VPLYCGSHAFCARLSLGFSYAFIREGRLIYVFDEYQLDDKDFCLTRGGYRLALEPKAIQVLLLMVTHQGKLLEKATILDAVWKNTFVEESTLTRVVALIRKQLGDNPKVPRFIETVPTLGYRFIALVEKRSPAAAEGAFIETESMVSVSSEALPMISPFRSLPWLRHVFVVLAFFVLASAALLWWRAHRNPPHSQKIVLADFDNRTGDTSFDIVLEKALEIGLDQSPYMDVMSEREAVSTLGLMGKAPDTALRPDVAKEVCERSNRQVLILGTIASVGKDYLLTLEATDCASGKVLTHAKIEVLSKEKILSALDAVTDKVRHGLGESEKSVERFQVPIAQATTSSLEALKNYSIGEYLLGRMGKEQTETLPLFQRAVELDPQFAMAHAAVATGYYNLGEYSLAEPYYQKAFDLSGHVSEKEKLYIRAHYYADDVKDLEQGIKAYQMWAETYPRDWGPWLNIAIAYTQLGQYSSAIAAAEQALKLDPSRRIIYSVLARAYLRANRYVDAKSTASRAVQVGRDSVRLHSVLFEIAVVDRSQTEMAREAEWSRGKTNEWSFLGLQARATASAGNFRRAEELFHAAHTLAEHENLAETADSILIEQASTEFDSGRPAAALSTLRRIKRQNADNPDLAFLKAKLGDFSLAEHLLAAQNDTNHTGTLMTYLYGPRLRAERVLQGTQSLDAIEALEPATPYEFAAGFTVLTQRGQAYLRSKRTDKAAAAYQRILASEGVDPTSILLPLAHLGLARTEAAAGHPSESRSEYEKLFALWKGADSDLPILLIARREYSVLITSGAQ
jgi:DNA-binding winged helix-turn-helix (wHTH) protein/tetratricopeptide (TPR) repeat protein